MKERTIINNSLVFGGFTSGSEGIWTRNAPLDPPTVDYEALGSRLEISLSRFIRPYQAGGDAVETVGAEHGGSGVIKDNDLRKTDGLITAEKGIVLSVIAADCVPVYLFDEKAEVIGLLHCGRSSAAGMLIHNAAVRMKELGAAPQDIHIIIGPHICTDCYEVGRDVLAGYSGVFTEEELDSIFEERDPKLYLDLSEAIRLKAVAEGIPDDSISAVDECTCHDTGYYSYRRGDRGKQNLAFILMK